MLPLKEANRMPGMPNYRTIWLSDVHLATRGCKADRLLDFLRHSRATRLYLVGDIFDGWRMRRSFFWTQEQNDVVQKLLRKIRKGTQAYYLPGNHDEVMRACLGWRFGRLQIVDEVVHETADGRRLLVMHGDRFDGVITRLPWLARLGESAYHAVLHVNDLFNFIRRRLGFSNWSLSDYIKFRVSRAVETVSNFKSMLAREARERGLDGVVCGHLHRPEIQQIDGIVYYNIGDWVENCTALVEYHDGRIEILHWPEAAVAGPVAEEKIRESAA
jgi:UDP-2,3-diacylglucosamine pyrophosphatase LpxH